MKKILLIEDENDLRGIYKEVLEAAGFAVSEAGDGQEGVDKALKEVPDLILLDIMLPKMDGLDVLKSIRQNSKVEKVPVVLLTNLGHESVIKEGFALGATAYLMKSDLNPGQVLEEVQKILK